MAFYWGISEWSAARITEAIELCDKKGLHPPVVTQPEYNMLNRDRFEKEYRPLFERNKMGTTVWGPMASGILSGKYNDGNFPEGSRMAGNNFSSSYNLQKYFNENRKEKTLKALNGMVDLAKELGYT